MKGKPGYKQTDLGIIPDDWDVRSVGSMGEVRAGKALAARGPGRRRPYLRTKNVFDGRIDLDDVLHMPMTEADFSRYHLRYGDVLLNEGQSIELVGRCAMYRDEFPEPCAIQNQLVRFRAREGVCAEFATHLFRFCQKSGVFSKIAMQTTSVAHLGVSRFHQLQLAWPRKLSEQKAIAGALGDTDALIESLEQLIAKKCDVKRGAMQELLTGKKRLPGFNNEWQAKPLGDCGEVIMGQSPPGSSYNRNGLGSPLINGPTEFTDQHPIKIQWTTQPARFCKAGDLLICVRGSSTGRTNYADDMYAIGRGVAAIRAKDHNDTEYLSYQVISAVSDILAAATGSTFPSVDGASFRKIVVPLPSPAEQSAIAAILSDMDAEITELEAKLAKARQVKQGMMQELLTGKTRLI
jgi:type I restriction enzyme S subunit